MLDDKSGTHEIKELRSIILWVSQNERGLMFFDGRQLNGGVGSKSW